MKKNYNIGFLCLLCAIIGLFGSCKKNESLEEKGLSNNHKSVAVAGDSVWDVLGYGYDVTGPAMDFNCISDAPVIDVARFALDYKQRIDNPTASFGRSKYIFGATAMDYAKEIVKNRSFTIEAKVGDVTSVTQNYFTGSATYTRGSQTKISTSSKYSYASFESFVHVKRLRFTRDATISLLMNYLAPEFTTNVANQDAETLVKRYGTHVLVDISLGGRLMYEHKSYQLTTNNESQKKDAVKASLFGGLLKVVGITASTDLSKEVIEKSMTDSRERTYTLYYYGGTNSGTSVSFDANGNTTQNLNIAGWESSVNDRNCMMIGFDRAIPLDELIADPVKAAAVKSYITQYILDAQIRLDESYPVTDLYRCRNTKSNDRLLTANPQELNSLQNWVNEGSVGKIYTTQRPGTVPLYRTFLNNAAQHLFTLNWSEAHLGTFEGIAGYVSPTQEEGMAPIYRYQHSKYARLYTNNFAELGYGASGYTLEGNIGYLLQ